MGTPISLTMEEGDAMRRGDKLDAIRLLRHRTGLGLVEAKWYVEHWDGKTAAPDGPAKPCPHCGGSGFLKATP